MLTLLIFSLIFASIGTPLAVHINQKNKSEGPDEAEPPKLLNEAEETEAWLEAASEVSPTAARALHLLKTDKNKAILIDTSKITLALPEPKKEPLPKWTHISMEPTPAIEQWKLTVKDMDRCVDDAKRLQAIIAWMSLSSKPGAYFTHTEKQLLLDLFTTQAGRFEARKVLWPQAKEKLEEMEKAQRLLSEPAATENAWSRAVLDAYLKIED